MSAELVLQYLLAALQAAPLAINAGMTIETWVSQTSAALKTMQAENRDPSPAEWAALNAQLLAALDALAAAKPGVAPVIVTTVGPGETLDQAAVGS